MSLSGFLSSLRKRQQAVCSPPGSLPLRQPHRKRTATLTARCKRFVSRDLTADSRLAGGTEPAACGNRAMERSLSSTGRAWQSLRIKRLCIYPHPTLPLGLRFHTRKLKRQPASPRCSAAQSPPRPGESELGASAEVPPTVVTHQPRLCRQDVLWHRCPTCSGTERAAPVTHLLGVHQPRQPLAFLLACATRSPPNFVAEPAP